MVKSILLEQVSSDLLMSRFDALESLVEKILKNQNPPPKPEPKPEGYLSRRQVANLLNVSLPTVADWSGKGILKARRIGRRVLFLKSEVEQALQSIPARGAATR